MSEEEIQKIRDFFKKEGVKTREEVDSKISLTSQVVRVSRIHKRTKSKKLIRYQLVVLSGNPEVGIFGIGVGKNEEYREALREGINKSKKKLKLIDKGCGFNECPCNGLLKHSITSRKKSKVGSTVVELIPASLKTGLRTSPTGKRLLSLAGIEDIMVVARGNKNNKLNMAKAIYEAI